MSIELYFTVGTVIGVIVGFLVFVAAYIYYITVYGSQFGGWFGWLPSLILAAAVGWFAMVIWPIILVVVAVLVLTQWRF